MIIKKFSVLYLSIFIAVTGSTVLASPAGAAQWLVNGASILGLQSTETTGTLKLIAEGEPIIGTVEVTCSMILDGTISPAGLDEVTSLLNLKGEAISGTPLTGASLACTNVSKCASPEAWAVNLPWESHLEGPSIDLTTDPVGVGYEVKCKGVIGEPSDTCQIKLIISRLENIGAENDVSVLTEEVKKLGCEVAGLNKGSIVSTPKAILKVLEGLALATSE